MRGLAALLGLLVALPAATQQPPGDACPMACRVSQATPSPEQSLCLAQCMASQPISRDAPGPAATTWPPPQPQTPATPMAEQPPAMARPNIQPLGVATGLTAGEAVAAPRPGSPPATHGAFYLGATPSMSYGVSVAQRDRSQAHRLAEIACRRRGGHCALQQEFSDVCVTLVEGVRRSPGAFFMTSDPSTYIVRAITLGAAGNPADAARLARDLCTLRERGGLTCRIVHAECGAR